jgi:hypothetical protein
MDKTPSPSVPKIALALGLLGVIVTVLGLVQVNRGDIILAPILLVVAYFVLFPLALTRLR